MVADPIINLRQGIVKGKVCQDQTGTKFYSFQGIPYAKPPLGRLRFKAPEPPELWYGVLDATRDPPPCYQRELFHADKIIESEGPTRCQSDRIHPGKIIGSEDCLYLNVYTPQLGINYYSYPVMVWIHGGGFVGGSGNSDYCGPEFLMTQDIILVTFNYRVGMLGFLSMENQELGIHGNAGLKDQVMALQWVRKNISRFRGNAKKVTIFGQDAGAASVHLHVLSPMSKGLFQKAIIQSGCALNPWVNGVFDNITLLSKAVVNVIIQEILEIEYMDKEELDRKSDINNEEIFKNIANYTEEMEEQSPTMSDFKDETQASLPEKADAKTETVPVLTKQPRKLLNVLLNLLLCKPALFRGKEREPCDKIICEESECSCPELLPDISFMEYEEDYKKPLDENIEIRKEITTMTEDEKILRLLQMVPVDLLYHAQEIIANPNSVDVKWICSPVVEKQSNAPKFLEDEPLKIILSGNYNHVPIVIGYTSEEGMFMDLNNILAIKKSELISDYTTLVPNNLNAKKGSLICETIAKQIKEYYYDMPDSPRLRRKEPYFKIFTDIFFLRGIYSTIKNHLKTAKCPIYCYKFSLNTKLNIFKWLIPKVKKYKGACHGDERGYLFETVLNPEIKMNSLEDRGSKIMISLWTTFAETGQPASTHSHNEFDWTPTTKDNFHVLNIDEQCKIICFPEADRMAFWDFIYRNDKRTRNL